MKTRVLILSTLMIFSYSIFAGGVVSTSAKVIEIAKFKIKQRQERNNLYYKVNSLKDEIKKIEDYLKIQSSVFDAEKKDINIKIKNWKKLENSYYSKYYYDPSEYEKLEAKFNKTKRYVDSEIKDVFLPEDQMIFPDNSNQDDEKTQLKRLRSAKKMQRLVMEIDDESRQVDDEFGSSRKEIHKRANMIENFVDHMEIDNKIPYEDMSILRKNFIYVLQLKEYIDQNIAEKLREEQYRKTQETLENIKQICNAGQKALDGTDQVVQYIAKKCEEREQQKINYYRMRSN